MSSPAEKALSGQHRYDLDAKSRRDVGAVLSRTIVTQGFRLGRNLLILPLIVPAELGIYSYVTVILGYLVHLHLGTFNVFSLRYPELDAAGQSDRAEALRRLAWQVAVAGSLLSFIVLAGILGSLGRWAWPVVALLAAFGATNLWSKHITQAYFATQRFREQARIEGIVAVVGFASSLVGALTFGVTGLLMATLATPLMKICLARGMRFPAVRRPIETGLFKENLGAGIRLWWNAFASEARIGLDVILLKHILQSATAFGLYAFGSVIALAVATLSSALAQVHSIHLTRVVGATGDVGSPEVREQMERSVARDYLAALCIASVTACFLAFAVPLLAPRYEPAMALLGPFLAAGAMQRLIKHPRILLLLAKRTDLANVAAYVSVAVLLGLIAFVTLALDANLLAFAGCSAIAYLSGAVAMFILCQRTLNHGPHGRRFSAKMMVSVLPLGVLNLSWAMPDSQVGLALGGLISLVVGLLLFRVVFPGTVRSTAELLVGSLHRSKKSNGNSDQ